VSDLEPPVDYGWLSEEQGELLLKVGAQPGGWDVVRTYAMVVKMRVDACKERGLNSVDTVNTVMEHCWNSYPGIPDDILTELTRGLINCALEEHVE
jgi:hypothetical protein